MNAVTSISPAIETIKIGRTTYKVQALTGDVNAGILTGPRGAALMLVRQPRVSMPAGSQCLTACKVPSFKEIARLELRADGTLRTI